MTCIEEVAFPGPWRQRGACGVVPTQVFFPGRGQSVEPAKAVCRACPVITECREYALGISDLKGIWGGLAEEER
ncbi:MAG: WhiB family transcriptional regulator, partial [Acidimicrobiales bacterium]